MSVFIGIVLGLLTLLILILLHELGHFVAAKLSGAYVYEFAIGFGPTIFCYKGKETWFSIRLIPIGGFNYIASKDQNPPDGRENEEVSEDRKIESIKSWKKTIFILTGPLVNFFITLIIFTIAIPAANQFPNDPYFAGATYSSKSKTVLDESKTVNKYTIKYDQDISLIGMRIYSYNNKEILLEQSSYYQDSKDNNKDNNINYSSTFKSVSVFYDKNDIKAPTYFKTVYSFIDQVKASKSIKADNLKFQLIYKIHKSYSLDFTNDKEYITSIDTKSSDYSKGQNIGIAAPNRYFKSGGAAYAFAWKEVFVQISSILKAIGSIFTGNISNVSGPIGIVKTASLASKNGITFFIFVGSISASLFMFNMFFIPPLDGFRFIETLYEWITRKEINQKVKYIMYSIGALVMILLILVTTILDIIK